MGEFAVQKICHSSPSNCHPQLAGFSYFWLTLGCLGPHTTSLVGSTSGVLKQSCSGWWNCLMRPLAFWQTCQAWPRPQWQQCWIYRTSIWQTFQASPGHHLPLWKVTDSVWRKKWKVLCACGVCLWWTECSLVSLVCASISYRDTKRLTSGPATIHLRSADGSSVSPMAPPSALIVALACLWAWLRAKAEKCRLVLWTTKLPALNSCASCGCVLCSVSMSLRWIGSHLACVLLLAKMSCVNSLNAWQYRAKLASRTDLMSKNTVSSTESTCQKWNCGLCFFGREHHPSKLSAFTRLSACSLQYSS